MSYFWGHVAFSIEVAMEKTLVRLHLFGEQFEDKYLILALDDSMGRFHRKYPKGGVVGKFITTSIIIHK